MPRLQRGSDAWIHPLLWSFILTKLDVPQLLRIELVKAERMADDNDNEQEQEQEQQIEEGPEEVDNEDIGGETPDTAKALGLKDAPSAKAQGLLDQHPEIWPDYEETVLEKLVIREAYPPNGPSKDSDSQNQSQSKPKSLLTDTNHVTYPFVTMYERTKILSLRASQLAHGSNPFIDVPDYLTDVYEIAKAEFEAKRLPYFIKRPLPDGEYEYWRLADLMIL